MLERKFFPRTIAIVHGAAKPVITTPTKIKKELLVLLIGWAWENITSVFHLRTAASSINLVILQTQTNAASGREVLLRQTIQLTMAGSARSPDRTPKQTVKRGICASGLFVDATDTWATTAWVSIVFFFFFLISYPRTPEADINLSFIIFQRVVK